jgi:hypothetical protein
MKAIHQGKAKNDRLDTAKIAGLLRGDVKNFSPVPAGTSESSPAIYRWEKLSETGGDISESGRRLCRPCRDFRDSPPSRASDESLGYCLSSLAGLRSGQ